MKYFREVSKHSFKINTHTLLFMTITLFNPCFTKKGSYRFGKCTFDQDQLATKNEKENNQLQTVYEICMCTKFVRCFQKYKFTEREISNEEPRYLGDTTHFRTKQNVYSTGVKSCFDFI